MEGEIEGVTDEGVAEGEIEGISDGPWVMANGG